MKAIIFIILIIPFSIPSYAHYWTTIKETPFEVQALVESFKMQYMTEEEKKNLKNNLSMLDALIKDTPKEDHYFVSKTAIYKWLLKNSPHLQVPETFTLTDFKAKAKATELAPFPRWLLSALTTDALQLIQEPRYNIYEKLISQENHSYKKMKIHKRIKLIKPWLYLFQTEDATQVDLRMMKFHFSILNHIIAQLKVFHRFNNQTLPNPSQKLSYFSRSDQAPSPSQDQGGESKTMSALDEVIKEHKKAKLPLPTNDWTLSDEDSWTPSEQKTEEYTKLQKINIDNPEPEASYKAPENLPEPIDDWVWD